jgi:hypothetical protein
MYIGKWISGIVYLFTGGFFLLGVLYDFWTLNAQISNATTAHAPDPRQPAAAYFFFRAFMRLAASWTVSSCSLRFIDFQSLISSRVRPQRYRLRA